MDITIAIGLISFIATLAGIYIGFKYRFFLGRVTFLKEQIIPLFDTIVKNLPELSVSYKGNPVSPKLFLMKGALLNSGKRDISPTMVEKPITINLPEDYKWLEAKVINTSVNVKANINFINRTSIAVETGLFRNGEYIRFEAIIETPAETSGNIDDIIQFSHRIADLRKISKSEIKEGSNKFRFPRTFIFPMIMGILATIVFFGAYYLGMFPGDIVYSFNKSKNEVIDVEISPKKNNKLQVKGIYEKYNEIMSTDDFYSKINKIYVKKPLLFDRLNLILFLITFSLYICLPGLAIILLYMKFRKNKKLRMILNI